MRQTTFKQRANGEWFLTTGNMQEEQAQEQAQHQAYSCNIPILGCL